MITARTAHVAHIAHTAKLAFIVLVAALALPGNARAASGNVQICQKDGTCEVSEFLYNDSYVPISTATCSLKSRYPNGDIFVNSQPMTAKSDGLYSYNVAATGSAGIYPSTICCTAGGDYLCLDKTFEVATASSTLNKTDVSSAVWEATRSAHTVVGTFGEALQNAVPTTNDIAVAVWGYSGRTLSTFGSLVSDIWTYSTRSITTFGTLVADIWNNTTRTLTGNQLNGGKELATVDDIKVGTQSAVISIKGASNKDLSQLSSEVAGVKTDTASIKTTVDLVYADTQSIKATTSAILTKWGTLSAADISTKVDNVSNKLGTNTDDGNTATVFGRIQSVRDKWGTQTAQTIYDKANSAATTATSLQAELGYNGKTVTAYQDLQTLKGYVDTLETSIGLENDASTASTLFGRLKKVQDKVDTLSVIQTDLRGILNQWGTDNNIPSLYTKIVDIRTKLDTIGTVSTTTSLSQTTINDIANISNVLNQTTITNKILKELKNEVLTLSAVSEINRTLIEKTANKPIVKTFLLEGSVIFRSLITNPSTAVSQTEHFIYYLPAEVKREDILETDKELTLGFDTGKGQLFATGDIKLAPSETKTVSIRVENIWKISTKEVESLQKQTEELYKPLVGTAYFGQAVTIKSDNDVALSKVLELSKNGTTPEAKIKDYKEAQLLLKEVRVKIDRLKDLVSSASSAGSLTGFVGGAQVLAVWGLIVVMVAGFIFLALYMRYIRTHDVVAAQGAKDSLEEPIKAHVRPHIATARLAYAHVPNHTIQHHFLSSHRLRQVVILIGFGLSIAAVSVYGTYTLASQREKARVEVARLNKTTAVLGENAPLKKQKTARIVVPPGTLIDLRSEASSSSAVIETIKSSDYAVILDKQDVFTKVRVIDSEKEKEGWISSEFIKPSLKKKTVIINDTPTGFLRVRQQPGGIEIAQIKPGEEYLSLEETADWIQIQLANKTHGWVVKKYIHLGPTTEL